MIAVQGTYDNGILKLAEEAPVPQVDVIVIFPEIDVNKKKELNREDTRKLFDSLAAV